MKKGKRYNISIIMQNAWNIQKENNYSHFSTALKEAWKLHKSIKIENIYKEYYMFIYNILRKKVNNNNVEDCLQDYFIRLNDMLYNHNPIKYPVKQFVSTVLNSYVIDYYRTNKDNIINDEEVTDNDYNYSDEDNERIELLYNSIHKLKENQRNVIKLHLQGYTGTEIASKLKLSRANVRVLINRAKTNLKQKLEKVYI